MGSGENGERAHLEGQVAERCPDCEDVDCAAAHVDDVVVRAGKCAVGHDAQPLEVVGETGTVQEFSEELHQSGRFDEGEEFGRVGDGLGAGVEFAAFSFGDDAVLEGRSWLELLGLLQVLEDDAAGFLHFLAVVQVADEQVAFVLQAISQSRHVVFQRCRIA